MHINCDCPISYTSTVFGKRVDCLNVIYCPRSVFVLYCECGFVILIIQDILSVVILECNIG